MLEVGCAFGPGGPSDGGLTIQETRSHFGGWSIVSSPLTLSHDPNNDTIMDFIWPIISNTEAIAINQAYFGFSGTSFAYGTKYVNLSTVPASTSTNFEFFYKPLSWDGKKQVRFFFIIVKYVLKLIVKVGTF